jgi:hypothetical protein
LYVARFAARGEKGLSDSSTSSWRRRLAMKPLIDVRRYVGSEAMLDLIFIATTVVFFLIAIAYVRGCEKLQ